MADEEKHLSTWYAGSGHWGACILWGSFTTVNIAAVQMVKDPQGNQPPATCSSRDTLYSQVDLDNAPEDTVVRSAWPVVDANDVEDNTSIDSAALISGTGQLRFKPENDYPWPSGEYKVELFVEDERQEMLIFAVEG